MCARRENSRRGDCRARSTSPSRNFKKAWASCRESRWSSTATPACAPDLLPRCCEKRASRFTIWAALPAGREIRDLSPGDESWELLRGGVAVGLPGAALHSAQRRAGRKRGGSGFAVEERKGDAGGVRGVVADGIGRRL